MKWIIFTIIILLTATAFSFITSAPFLLSILINLAVITRKKRVFAFGILAGIIQDALVLRPLGLTSIYFTLVLGILFLYDKKFETRRPEFIAIFSFLTALIYSLLFKVSLSLLVAIVISITTVIIFYAYTAPAFIITRKRATRR